jgi:hypothetical protein
VAASASTDAPAAPPAKTHKRFPMWRRVLSAVLIILSCALLPLTVVTLWLRNEILSTDDYVRTVAPLARNEAVIDALATRVTNELFARVDVEDVAKDNLPSRISFLAGPLSNALESFTEQATLRFFESDAFQKLWDEANRLAHDQIVNALEGGGDVVSTKNGRVELNLTPIVEQLRDRLDERGITIFDALPIGTLALRFTLFDSQDLHYAQTGVRLLNTLRWVLPVLIVVCGAAGIYLAGNRRRALLRFGLGVMVAALILGFGLALGRAIYLDSLPADVSQPANSAAFDIVIRFLRTTNRIVFVIGLLVALACYLAGTSRVAVFIRGRTTGALDTVGDRAAATAFDFGGVARFVSRYANAFRIAGVILSFVVLILLDHPGVSAVLWLLIVLLVYLAVIQILARVARDRAQPVPVSQ